MLVLPVELIHQVIRHLSSADLVHLQSTCKDLRAILIAQMWSHVDLTFTGRQTLCMEKYVGEHHQCCKPGAFWHEHTCRRGGFVSTHMGNMRQFAKAALRGDFDLAYEWVRVLTIKTPFAINSDSERQLTIEDIDAASDDAVIAYVVNKLIPMFDQLRLIEVVVDMNKADCPVVPQLMANSHITTNIKINSKRGIDTPMLNFGNIKLLRINCDGKPFQPFFGAHLPATIERFDLVDFDQTNAKTLQTFFAKATRLTSVALEWGNGIANPDSINWLPDTVSNLHMDQFEEEGTTVQYGPLDALNVTSFKSYTRMGHVFKSIRLPNLERLCVQGPVDDEEPLVDAVAATCHTSPLIRQLKCRRLRVDFVASLMKQAGRGLGVKSLVVQPGKRTRPIDFPEYCRLATKLHDLDSLVINLNPLSANEVVRFLRKVMIFCPSIKNVFVEHLIIAPQPWLHKVPGDYVFDDYSRIRVSHCFSVDIDLFRQTHLASEKCQDRIKACAVRESMAPSATAAC